MAELSAAGNRSEAAENTMTVASNAPDTKASAVSRRLSHGQCSFVARAMLPLGPDGDVSKVCLLADSVTREDR